MMAGASGPPARTSLGVRPCEQPAEVRPAGGVADQQGQVAAVVEVELGAVQSAQAERLRALGELHRARNRVVVGQAEALIAELERSEHEFLGQRGAVEERVGRVGMQLRVNRHERMFALIDGASETPHRAWRTVPRML